MKDINKDEITLGKRTVILSLVVVVSLSLFLVVSGPLSSSLLLSSPIKQVRAQQQPTSQPQRPTSQPSSRSQQPSSQPQQPSSQPQQPSSQPQRPTSQPSSRSQQPSSQPPQPSSSLTTSSSSSSNPGQDKEKCPASITGPGPGQCTEPPFTIPLGDLCCNPDPNAKPQCVLYKNGKTNFCYAPCKPGSIRNPKEPHDCIPDPCGPNGHTDLSTRKCICDPGYSLSNGKCLPNVACTLSSPSPSPAATFTKSTTSTTSTTGIECNGTCVDLSNPNTCGTSCDDIKSCAAPTGGTATCTNGQCGQQCPQGQEVVNGACQPSSNCGPDPFRICSGVCTNINSDNDNCGRCGNACHPDAGVTKSACGSGFCQCQTGLILNANNFCVCPDGSTLGTPNNCGTCGNGCGAGFCDTSTNPGGQCICPPGGC